MAIAACFVVAGCQTAKVTEPVTATLGGRDPDQQIEFWHTLAERPVTCNDDAFHGLLLYIDGDDAAKDYGERVKTLQSRKLLSADFAEPAGRAVERGTLAVAIAKSLDLRGGWAMRVFGPTPRYATRELQYLDLYPPSTPNQTFSGTEFVGIMGKFEDAQHADEPAVVAEPGRTLKDAADVLQPGDREPKTAK